MIFQTLSVFGIWMPVNYSSKLDKIKYQFYSIFIIPLPYLLAAGLIIRMTFSNISFDELTETLFMFLTTINVCSKSINFLLRRQEVIHLINMLSIDYAKPHDQEEIVIYTYYNTFIRFLRNNIFIFAIIF